MHEMSELASLFLYLIVYIISAYLMSRSKVLENKRLDIAFVIAVLLPVLLAANRYFVGTDFENYFLMYKSMSRCTFKRWISEETTLDGTPFGIWLISRISFQFRSHKMFYGLLATIIYVPAAIGMKKILPKESFFLAMFFYLTTTFSTGLNISKQAAAISILIFSLQYIQERKLKRFLLLYAAAVSFHPSALVFIVVYFLWRPEDTQFSFKRIVFFTCCIVFLNYIPQILTILGGRFENYTIYTEEISNRSFYLSLLWLVIFYLFRHKYKEVLPHNDLLIIMAIINQILNLSGFFSPFVNRISLYFGVSASLLRAQFPLLFCDTDKKFIKLFLFIYAIAIFVYSVYVLGGAEIIPYKFYIGE